MSRLFSLTRIFTLFLLGIATAVADVDFEKDVSLIIAKRCVECHNADDPKGGLDLSTLPGLTKGGDTGPAVVSGDSNASYLIERINSGEMPPPAKGESQKLPEQEINILVSWIDSGLTWPIGRTLDIYERTSDVRGGRDWWSLQQIERPALPLPLDEAWVNTPIDAFILNKLRQNDMSPAPRSDKRTLLRRLSYDLTGLPPTSTQTQSFLNDNSESAYETMVDTLLASSHFGERWARHWLDLIRFAETCGYERDQLKPNIWMYRDWVISAFNDDMPYDKFVRDQLAGDEVPYRDENSLIATGMIRAGTWNDEPNDPADYQYTRLEDMVHTTSSAFIGLTVKCARCHNHKFDPIKQTDYYRFANSFWSGYIGQADLGGPSEARLGSKAFAWTDRSNAVVPLNRLINGERTKPAEVVVPASISSIPDLERTFTPPPNDSDTTHQRLQLANWITHPEHPLTARVIVNRLWQHTMGEALVRTPNNFGFKGKLPTHPQLLDWLSAELVSGDWKMKRIIKLIVMSSVYQQQSHHEDQQLYSEKDYLNTLWWRAQRKRLDAEQLRDSILFASGQLNPAMGGPSFFPKMSPEALEGLSRKSGAWGNSPLSERNRRSIYMMTKRSRLLPLMTTFNFTDTTLPCGRRDVTTVAPQALALLNNHFVHQNSQAMANQMNDLHPADINAQIKSAWIAAIGREPESFEIEASLNHIRAQAKQFESQPSFSPAYESSLSIKEGLSVWLDAGQRIDTDEAAGVKLWGDVSGASKDGQFPIDAAQAEPTTRPTFVPEGIGGKPTLRFNGTNQLLKLTGTPFSNQQLTVIAVSSDASSDGRHREIISNWNSRGRSTTSLFLGTTGKGKIRFSDAFQPAGEIESPDTAFILTALNGPEQAATFVNGRRLATSASLAKRDLNGPYVVGTQGNFGTEYWQGDIAEIIIYDRALSIDELQHVWGYLSRKYTIGLESDQATPERLAFASLCHVLMNLNEFLYID